MAVRRRPIPLAGEIEDRRIREILTPEGIPIRFVLADVGQRINAFFIDLALIVGATIVIVIPAFFLGAIGVVPAGVGLGVGFLAWFLLWNFYFIWFELHWQGRTPGKRLVKIRAMDASGGPASADAIIARDIEFFVPLIAALSLAVSDSSDWLALGSILWLFLFALLPLFNRDRLRVGDLVAGTIVVRSPTSGLLRANSTT